MKTWIESHIHQRMGEGLTPWMSGMVSCMQRLDTQTHPSPHSCRKMWMRKWELMMKRHPPIHYSFSQTGAWCSCDSMISPPPHNMPFIRANIHASHVRFFLYIARLAFRHIYCLLEYIYHYTRRTLTWRHPHHHHHPTHPLLQISQWAASVIGKDYLCGHMGSQNCFCITDGYWKFFVKPSSLLTPESILEEK